MFFVLNSILKLHHKNFLFFVFTFFFSTVSAHYLIVIDPGHGGKDPGAIGYNSIYEKDIALLFAKTLKNELQKYKDFKIVMTRTKDKTLSLVERGKFIDNQNADLFISIHMDDSESTVYKGISLYTQSLVSFKNVLSGVSEFNFPDLDLLKSSSSEQNDALKKILLGFAYENSKNLADMIFSNIDNSLFHSNKLKEKNFYVLRRSIPNLLLEIGFIANKKDVDRILTTKSRKKIVSNLAKVIHDFYLQLD